MSRTDRRSKRAEARRYATLSTLGALGAVTAVGLGSAVPAQAAPADSAQARSPLYGARTFGGAVERTPHVAPAERSPHVGPVERAPQRSTVVYTVRSGDTVSGIAARYDTTVRAIIDANDLDSRALIRIGQTLRIPSDNGSGSGSSSSSSSNSSASSYKVRSGDTVSGIAAGYDTTVRAIIDANDLDSRALIRIGQTLRIPGSGGSSSSSQAAGGSSASTGSSSSTSSSSSATSYKVRSGDTVSGIAARHDTTVRAIINANDLDSRALIRIGQTLRIPSDNGSGGSSSSGGGSSSSQSAGGSSASTGSSSSSAESVSHKVRAGDTVSSIAAQYGSSVSDIVEANDLGANAVIRIGQTLRVPGGLVSNEFLHYTYSGDVTAAANTNKRQLLSANLPGRDQMRSIIRQTAQEMGVDPALALAIAHQESGFNPAAVSPANAVGVMQVIPSSGQWASQLVGYELNLLDPQDNVTAGVAILRQLDRMAENPSEAIGGYYQGLGSVQSNGLYDDTRRYVANVQTLMTRYS